MPPDVATPPRGLARLLFGLYCLLYAVFMGTNLLAPGLMAQRLGPANVAILSGLGLIVLAVVFALAYARWGASE